MRVAISIVLGLVSVAAAMQLADGHGANGRPADTDAIVAKEQCGNYSVLKRTSLDRKVQAVYLGDLRLSWTDGDGVQETITPNRRVVDVSHRSNVESPDSYFAAEFFMLPTFAAAKATLAGSYVPVCFQFVPLTRSADRDALERSLSYLLSELTGQGISFAYEPNGDLSVTFDKDPDVFDWEVIDADVGYSKIITSTEEAGRFKYVVNTSATPNARGVRLILQCGDRAAWAGDVRIESCASE
jgi:hypothetical protein